MKTYTIRSTISSSNGSIKIKNGTTTHDIDMNVSLLASVVKVKSQYFYIGQLFSNDSTVGATGSGRLDVFQMYKVFGDTLKSLISNKKEDDIEIECTAFSDDLEYDKRKLILKKVIFDQIDLMKLDDQNTDSVVSVPFTFGDLEFVDDFNQ